MAIVTVRTRLLRAPYKGERTRRVRLAFSVHAHYTELCWFSPQRRLCLSPLFLPPLPLCLCFCCIGSALVSAAPPTRLCLCSALFSRLVPLQHLHIAICMLFAICRSHKCFREIRSRNPRILLRILLKIPRFFRILMVKPSILKKSINQNIGLSFNFRQFELAAGV